MMWSHALSPDGESDNIGLIILVERALQPSPMTTDRAMVTNYIKDIRMGIPSTRRYSHRRRSGYSINRIKGREKPRARALYLSPTAQIIPRGGSMTAAEIAKKDGYKGIYHRCRSKRTRHPHSAKPPEA